MSKLFLVAPILMATLHAQDAAAILQRLEAANKQNEERANRYTYTEDAIYFTYDKKGQAKQDRTETYDVIFVEGESYKRLIASDGKPLSAKEQAREEKKMRQTAEERRKARRSGLFHREVNFGFDDVRKFFDSRVLGEEDVDGRKAWVIEATPRVDFVPSNEHERDVSTFQEKLWVDQMENVALKMNISVIRKGSLLQPGSFFTFEFQKINDDAWLQVSGITDVRAQIAKVMRSSERTEYKDHDFKKFDVESTITIEGER